MTEAEKLKMAIDAMKDVSNVLSMGLRNWAFMHPADANLRAREMLLKTLKDLNT